MPACPCCAARCQLVPAVLLMPACPCCAALRSVVSCCPLVSDKRLGSCAAEGHCTCHPHTAGPAGPLQAPSGRPEVTQPAGPGHQLCKEALQESRAAGEHWNMARGRAHRALRRHRQMVCGEGRPGSRCGFRAATMRPSAASSCRATSSLTAPPQRNGSVTCGIRAHARRLRWPPDSAAPGRGIRHGLHCLAPPRALALSSPFSVRGRPCPCAPCTPGPRPYNGQK
jgi:hypothetical protein